MNYQKQFQYNEQIIGRYIDTLTEHNAAEDQVRRLLSHVLNALEIWVSRIKAEDAPVKAWDEHEISTLHEMNRNCHRHIHRILESDNLFGIYHYKNSKGEDYTSSLDEILTHLIIHSAHHRAQIAALWSAEGVKPPSSDFIFWARQS